MASSSPLKIIGGGLGVAVLGVVGYLLYKKFSAPRILDAPQSFKSDAGPTKPNYPTLQRVQRGEKLATAATTLAPQKSPNMKYAKITGSFVDQAGRTVRQFTANVDGFFTNRLLKVKNSFFAEIRPA